MKTVVWFGFVFFVAFCAAADQVTVTKPGTTINLECGVSTFKSSVEWKYGNERICYTEKKGAPRKGRSDTATRSTVRITRLSIRDVKEIDAGQFTCIVDGKTFVHTLLVVSVSAIPSNDFQLGSEVTLQCKVKGLNSDAAVKWFRPDGSKHTGSETVQLKSMSDSGIWNCTFSHDRVTYGKELEIKVKEPKPATTTASKPSRGPKINGGSKGPSNSTTDAGLLLGLSWWMWVIIGVGCLVVVLLTVLVICLCKRIRRRRRKLHKMKNSRQLPRQYCQCNRPTAAAKPQQRRRREKPSALPLQPLLLE